MVDFEATDLGQIRVAGLHDDFGDSRIGSSQIDSDDTQWLYWRANPDIFWCDQRKSVHVPDPVFLVEYPLSPWFNSIQHFSDGFTPRGASIRLR